jgi:hypothetical protein
MRKTYALQVEGKHPDRVLDAIKHDIRKYIKRERRRALPAGVDFWDFDCKFGDSEATAVDVHLNDITGLINAAAEAKAAQFFVQIVAKHGHRTAKPVSPDASTEANSPDDLA